MVRAPQRESMPALIRVKRHSCNFSCFVFVRTVLLFVSLTASRKIERDVRKEAKQCMQGVVCKKSYHNDPPRS